VNCGKEFQERWRLNEHIKRSHATTENRTCPHCHKTLANSTFLSQHINRCPQRATNNLECVLPSREITSRISEGRKRLASPRHESPLVESYLPCLCAYLLRGGFYHTFPTTRNHLAEKTVINYISFIRKYLEAVVVEIKLKKQKTGILFLCGFIYFLWST